MDEPTLSAPQRIALLFAIGISICMGGFFFAVVMNKSKQVTVPKSSPFVFVDINAGSGHGSATHLGSGYFLTAGHVTKDAKVIGIKTNDGYSYNAEILWQNNQYDVAMLYVSDYKKIGSARLSCADNYVGQSITVTGNPLGTFFAQSWGRVSALGKTGLEEIYDGMWKKLITLDLTAAPGVSGAGIVNDQGQVVGILVAGAISQRGNFNYSYAVSGKTICHVMART